MSATFVEVSSPPWAFWRVCLDTCIGLVCGTVLAFLGILVMGIVGEEALSSLYREIELDPVVRASMGAVLASGAILGILVPLVLSAERLAAFRAVEADERVHPEGVPPRRLRERLSTSPYVTLRRVGTVMFWCAAGLGALATLVVVVTEDLRAEALSGVVLVAFLVLALLALLVRRAGTVGVRRTEGRVADRLATWQRLIPEAEAEQARRRKGAVRAAVPRWLRVPTARTIDRIAGVLLVATGVSLAAFMVSVYLRQQCRTCEPVYWDEPVETGIDVLSLGSGIAIAICAALGLIAWIGGVLLQRTREIALARWVAESGPHLFLPSS